MRLEIVDSLENIPAASWNRLVADRMPFLRHEFLHGLELHGCVGQKFGWLPRHLVAYLDGAWVAAMPLYLKDNSYGELVFDWAWADAYHRHGVPYYPKLVSAIPYTPATGRRLLFLPGLEAPVQLDLTQRMLEEVWRRSQSWNCSSVHGLFPTQPELADWERAGYFPRLGCQFHWHNQNYRDFADYLDRFSAEKRKKLKRERRRVEEADIVIECLHGNQLSDEQWRAVAYFYSKTFHEKGGIDTLNLPFFRHVGATMPDQFVVFLASYRNKHVAAAICFKSDNTLYGRHWGCAQDFHSLHFELCYYQGIAYCIENGLTSFEPGAQGEHKVARGFEPTATWSAHRLHHPQFHALIEQHIQRENAATHDYMEELRMHLPFKSSA